MGTFDKVLATGPTDRWVTVDPTNAIPLTLEDCQQLVYLVQVFFSSIFLLIPKLPGSGATAMA